VTFSPTSTPLVNKIVFGPNPVKRGASLSLYSPTAFADCEWTVLSPDQQIVARLRFVAENPPVFTHTERLAPGVYIIKVKGHDVNGNLLEFTRKVLIRP
jgi:hypothetical protein